MSSKFINLIVGSKRWAVLLALLILAGLLSSFLFLRPGEPPVLTKPPVVGVNTLKVISANPMGNTSSLNTLFPVSVKFSESLGSDLSGIYVDISPAVPFDKYVVSSLPDALWLAPRPVSTAETRGWVDGVTYTVLIEKGSKISSGAVLKEDYSFSFSNSTEGVSMFAE
ncbi:MAG: hypothetical protein WC834_02520 [Eubacteriales bacterium]